MIGWTRNDINMDQMKERRMNAIVIEVTEIGMIEADVIAQLIDPEVVMIGQDITNVKETNFGMIAMIEEAAMTMIEANTTSKSKMVMDG